MIADLKLEISKNKGEFICAKEFLNEAIMWLEFIGELEYRCEHITNSSADRLFNHMFMLNNVTMNYCALLNWIATVSLLKDNVSNRQMGEFIAQSFKWPRHICETFMNCVRNPSVHIGRAYPWGEYNAKWPRNEKQHGTSYTFTGAFDSSIASAQYRLPPKTHPAYEEVRRRVYDVGFFERQSRKPPELGKEMMITFYYPAFRKLTAKTALQTFRKIKAFDADQTAKLEELRNRLSVTRVPAPENMG